MTTVRVRSLVVVEGETDGVFVVVVQWNFVNRVRVKNRVRYVRVIQER